MRNTEERVAAVRLRVREIDRQKELQSRQILVILSFVASLIFIVGLSFFLPLKMANLPGSVYTYSGAGASIFDGSDSFAYVFVGFLSFLLGVSVTILSFRIHLRNKREEEKREDRDG